MSDSSKKELALLRSQIEVLQKENAALKERASHAAAGQSKLAVVQEALASFQKLADANLITAVEHAARRAHLLDKLADAADDAPAADGDAALDPLFLREEVHLGGRVLWLAMHRKNLVKYPFGKPFAKPLLGALVAAREQVPKGIDSTPVHCVEIAHENSARLLGFNRYFFVIVDKDSLEILNVYRYDQMKRWIFQTFLTVDFGRYESKYFMFRMEIDKARAIQKLLLKYIDIAMADKTAKAAGGGAAANDDDDDSDDQEGNVPPAEQVGWLESFFQ